MLKLSISKHEKKYQNLKQKYCNTFIIIPFLQQKHSKPYQKTLIQDQNSFASANNLYHIEPIFPDTQYNNMQTGFLTKIPKPAGNNLKTDRT